MPESVLTAEHLAKQVYLAPQKREQIKGNIQALEWALRGRSMYGGMDMPRDVPIMGYTPPEPEILRESVARDRALLEASTPPNLSNLEKNRLYRRLKDLDAAITHDMPTYDMMEVAHMNNVEHHMAWEKAHKKGILERRNILRILDPENDSPFFTSVEQLRTATPPKGNPRRYSQAFDYIEFQEQTEEELQVIDDTSYGHFLELKCAGWAEATICKEMNWPKELYNVAMKRWRKAITDGSYTKFLELQAIGRPATEIRELLGWSQDFYDDATERWKQSVGIAPQTSHHAESPKAVHVSTPTPMPIPMPTVEAPTNGMVVPGTGHPVETPDDLTMPDTPWFAPQHEQQAAIKRSAEIGAVFAERLKVLDLRVKDVAKMLKIHHLTLGRKLGGKGKVTLTAEEIKALTKLCDKIAHDKGYVDPTDIPLGGEAPATAGNALQGVA